MVIYWRRPAFGDQPMRLIDLLAAKTRQAQISVIDIAGLSKIDITYCTNLVLPRASVSLFDV